MALTETELAAKIKGLNDSRTADNLQPNAVLDVVAMWTALVSRIWPQPFKKLGKILFLITRYPQIPQLFIWLSWFLPSRGPWSLKGCIVLFELGTALEVLSIGCAEVSFWICLYALLEGKRKYFAIIVLVWLGFFIPIQTIQSMGFATYIDRTAQTAPAIERGPFDRAYGYSCRYANTPGTQAAKYELVTLYMALARTILFMIASVVVIFVRYRRRNSLLTVIRRERGMYYICSSLVLFFACVIRTPGFPVENPYISRTVIKVLRNLAQYIFAERLLLQMQKTVYKTIRAQTAMSTLVFDDDKVPKTEKTVDHELSGLSVVDTSPEPLNESEFQEGVPVGAGSLTFSLRSRGKLSSQ
ncbi:hypothetical protein DFP72DRAFT_855980 [Ephemerocybe angulata]|uniref:Uncharacterized protein n=1 Tax=Ephemerocybe angulata TaxID=980116 RepID=A0A8H6HG61_9AGAR|nr:hypothetical protein DFP72DRAFT_855980 [Tulosesus angulatus]